MKRKRTWHVSKPTYIVGGCWSHHKRYAWQCDRKARPGKLTCWQHTHREAEAREHAAFLEAESLKTTCFHCGDPAVPETFDESPRCGRHRDV